MPLMGMTRLFEPVREADGPPTVDRTDLYAGSSFGVVSRGGSYFSVVGRPVVGCQAIEARHGSKLFCQREYRMFRAAGWSGIFSTVSCCFAWCRAKDSRDTPMGLRRGGCIIRSPGLRAVSLCTGPPGKLLNRSVANYLAQLDWPDRDSGGRDRIVGASYNRNTL